MNEATESILQAKGISPTAVRIRVLEYLQQQPAAISLQDLEQGFGPADKITLYRTLKTFRQQGLVHAVNDGAGAVKYALCAEACGNGLHYDLHLHFRCSACGKTVCLPKHPVPPVSLPKGFALAELQLLATGTCDACAQNNAIGLHGPGG